MRTTSQKTIEFKFKSNVHMKRGENFYFSHFISQIIWIFMKCNLKKISNENLQASGRNELKKNSIL
jgi:hypothetical protein